MSNRFAAQPEILKTEGNEILDKSERFAQNVNKIYATIEEMLKSSYMSPAAVSIAREIEGYREDLGKMTKVIRNYGNYCVKSAGIINKNESNIIDNVNTRL